MTLYFFVVLQTAILSRLVRSLTDATNTQLQKALNN